LQVQNPTVSEVGFSGQQSVQAGAPTQAWFDQYQGMQASTMLPQLSDRLKALGSKGQGYVGAKAQCWVGAAQSEYQAGNQWGFVQEAMGEADRLIKGLETGQSMSSANPPLRTVAQIRPDLWARIHADEQKASDGKDCDQLLRMLACSEVQLMYAGHDAWRRSFDDAEKRANDVADRLNGAEPALAQCSAKPAPAPLVPQIRTLKADALFHFDRGDEAGLLPAGKTELEQLARELGSHQGVQRIEVVGYTDRLGSASYNMRLSERRAATVQKYLADHGAARISMTHHGEGASQPVVQCDQRDRQALIACLAPNRRVEILIYAESQSL
jgi:outer membrane protein OmpA-like peptidoglycan-associated protein